MPHGLSHRIFERVNMGVVILKHADRQRHLLVSRSVEPRYLVFGLCDSAARVMVARCFLWWIAVVWSCACFQPPWPALRSYTSKRGVSSRPLAICACIRSGKLNSLISGPFEIRKANQHCTRHLAALDGDGGWPGQRRTMLPPQPSSRGGHSRGGQGGQWAR